MINNSCNFHSRTSTALSSLVVYIVLVATLVASGCGTWLGNPVDEEESRNDDKQIVEEPEDDNDIVVAEQMPAGSTGVMSLTSLNFTTTSAADGFPLADDAFVQVSDHIKVTTALFNIARVRFRADSAKTTADEEIERREAEDEEAADSDTEAAEIEEIEEEYDEKIGKAKGHDKQKMKEEKAAKMARKKQEHAANRKNADKERAIRIEKADKSIKLAGPIVYDAVAQTMSEEPDTFKLNDGTYKRVQFQLKQFRDG